MCAGTSCKMPRNPEVFLCVWWKTKFWVPETVYNTRRGWGGVGRENIGVQGALVPATSATVARASATRVRLLATPASCPGCSLPLSYTEDASHVVLEDFGATKRAGPADEMRDQLEARTAGSSCGTEHGCSRTRGSASSDRARPYGLAQRPARRARAGTPRKSEAPARLQWGGERHRARRERLRTLAMDDVQAEHAIFRACAGSQLAHASSVTRPRGSMSLLFRALTRLHFVAGAGSVDSAAAAPLAPG